MLDIQANKEKFIQIFKGEIHREGAENLLEWIENSDFFTAPGSGQYTLSCTGGLCQRAINKFICGTEMLEKYREKDPNFLLDPELLAQGEEGRQQAIAEVDQSLAIVTLLGDICQANCWTQGTKNVKTPEGKWVAEACWKWDEEFVFGHGAKSVFIINQFMRLYMEEAQAIRFHSQGKEVPYGNTFEDTYYTVYENNLFASFIGAVFNEAENVLDRIVWAQHKPQ